MKTLTLDAIKHVSGGATASATVSIQTGTTNPAALDMTDPNISTLVSEITSFLSGTGNGDSVVDALALMNVDMGDITSLTLQLSYA